MLSRGMGSPKSLKLNNLQRFCVPYGPFYPTEAKTVNFELVPQPGHVRIPREMKANRNSHESTDFVEYSPESWLFSLTSVSFSPFDGFEAQVNAALTAAD
jgi:hypothetical protein